jgi:hypothetical protein
MMQISFVNGALAETLWDAFASARKETKGTRYTPDRVRMFLMNKEQDEATPVCVTDGASLAYYAGGLATCEEQCYQDSFHDHQ